MKKIGVIDYGVGNLTSVKNALEFLGAKVVICSEPSSLKDMAGLILPGVGSFPSGINKLRDLDLVQSLEEAVKKGTPVLGICLGMQLLAKIGKEFEEIEGLSYIDDDVGRMSDKGGKFRIPHIGWNEVIFKDSLLSKGLGETEDFYFVHSYAFLDPSKDHVKGVCHYGNPIVSLIEQDNVFGAQFHPEKSQKAGLSLIKNFIDLC